MSFSQNVLNPSGFSKCGVPRLRDIAGVLTPLTVFQLRHLKGDPPDFEEHKTRYRAEDLAWLVSGSSTDNNHELRGRDKFHDALLATLSCKYGRFTKECRSELEKDLRTLLFDVATALDRSFGGSTMVIHVDGTTAPDTPSQPDFLKARVYLPPATVVSELPGAHRSLAHIVQSFIEDVGVPTTERWLRAARGHLGWRLTASGHRTPNPVPLDFIPAPEAVGSSVYKIYGRPRGDPSLLPSSTTAGSSVRQQIGPALHMGSQCRPGQNSSSESFEEKERMYLKRISELETAIANLCGNDFASSSSVSLDSPSQTTTPVRSSTVKIASHSAKGKSALRPPLSSPSPLAPPQTPSPSKKKIYHIERSMTTETSHSASAATGLGYDEATLQIIRLLLANPAQYWQHELELAGVSSDDVMEIINAMTRDVD